MEISLKRHAIRITLLMALAGGICSWLFAHTEILIADGLRYIRQAQNLDRGAWSDGLRKAVDHPIYPLTIMVAHRCIGGETPESWMRSAQATSILSGILWVIPTYLVASELFSASSAWLACLLTLCVPLTGHVLADTLSESTFLLFWTWGLWAVLRFLREGTAGWLQSSASQRWPF
jgi:4-amino-4-deoxy-L-arabinose transferase-like glycosyltransferase